MTGWKSCSRMRFAWKSEDCLPLTGVTGSLCEMHSESSSLSSYIGLESCVGYWGGDDDRELPSSGRDSKKQVEVELSCSI